MQHGLCSPTKSPAWLFGSSGTKPSFAKRQNFIDSVKAKPRIIAGNEADTKSASPAGTVKPVFARKTGSSTARFSKCSKWLFLFIVLFWRSRLFGDDLIFYVAIDLFSHDLFLDQIVFATVWATFDDFVGRGVANTFEGH